MPPICRSLAKSSRRVSRNVSPTSQSFDGGASGVHRAPRVGVAAPAAALDDPAARRRVAHAHLVDVEAVRGAPRRRAQPHRRLQLGGLGRVHLEGVHVHVAPVPEAREEQQRVAVVRVRRRVELLEADLPPGSRVGPRADVDEGQRRRRAERTRGARQQRGQVLGERLEPEVVLHPEEDAVVGLLVKRPRSHLGCAGGRRDARPVAVGPRRASLPAAPQPCRRGVILSRCLQGRLQERAGCLVRLEAVDVALEPVQLALVRCIPAAVGVEQRDGDERALCTARAVPRAGGSRLRPRGGLSRVEHPRATAAARTAASLVVGGRGAVAVVAAVHS